MVYVIAQSIYETLQYLHSELKQRSKQDLDKNILGLQLSLNLHQKTSSWKNQTVCFKFWF